MPTKMKKLLIVFLCIFTSFSASVSLGYNAGFQKLIYNKNKISLWYPSEAKEQVTSYWKWSGKVADNSAFSKGIFPILIFSHGMEGSMYNQYYLAEYMARNGYIVASVEHDDKSYTLQTLVDRPILIKKAIDLILNDLKINTHIDPNKIGILGHSLGGYTSFIIAGGCPDFSNHPSLSGLPNFLKKLYIKFRNFDNSFYDSRIKAIAALAPGLGTLFNKKSLSKVSIPVLIIEAEKDEVVLDRSVSLYKNNLPKKPKFMVLKGIGHYGFLPICNQYLQKNFTEICSDPEVLRKESHKIIEQSVLDFFNEVFK